MLATNKVFTEYVFHSFLIKTFFKKNLMFIKGPLGTLFFEIPAGLVVERLDLGLKISGPRELNSIILVTSKLLAQKIKGVELGFFEILTINGIGWRVVDESGTLVFILGFSHPINYKIKSGIEVTILDKQKFKLFGLDLCQIRQMSADLRKLRPLDVYKGKGIRTHRNIAFKLKVSSKSKS